MIKAIDFLAVAQLQMLGPLPDTVVISILDKSEESERPDLSGFFDALILQFEDTYEEAKSEEPGSWPDEPTDEEHARFCICSGERAPTLTDAKRIVEFIQRHHAGPAPLNLVIHCHAGISRSAAVAEWASVRLWVPLSFPDMRSTDRANLRVMRLLNKAAGIR